jgi:rfaE bifunctional protein nucleotidyltransferase chain/domain
MIVERNDLARLGRELHEQGKRIVTTNGCFDIMHAGHANYLKQAASLGDVLIVGVNGDASPYWQTKPGRPIIPAQDRIALVDALASVDYCFLFDEETPIPWVRDLRPDIHVKSADASYGLAQCVEKNAVEAVGGKVMLLPKLEGRSTSEVIAKILRTYGTHAHR